MGSRERAPGNAPAGFCGKVALDRWESFYCVPGPVARIGMSPVAFSSAFSTLRSQQATCGHLMGACVWYLRHQLLLSPEWHTRNLRSDSVAKLTDL